MSSSPVNRIPVSSAEPERTVVASSIIIPSLSTSQSNLATEEADALLDDDISPSPGLELEPMLSSLVNRIPVSSSPPPSSPPQIFTSSPEPEPETMRASETGEPAPPPILISSPPTSPIRSSSPFWSGSKSNLSDTDVYKNENKNVKGSFAAPTVESSCIASTSANLLQLQLPAPKRSTHASQKRSLQKLSTPFRTPAMRAVINAEQPVAPTVSQNKKPTPSLELKKPLPSPANLKHRTIRASSQFKSPLTSSTLTGLGSIRLTPNIQMLERKAQLLKRAIKVKRENEEEVLKGLVKMWTEAGREVAWELFEIGKERTGDSGGSLGGGVRKFEDSWGWSDKEDVKRVKVEQGDSWSWDIPAVEGEGEVIDVDEYTERMQVAMDEDEEGEGKEDTIGTMLRQLGIDPQTFGWDDGEGTFLDR
uniref:Swi5-dependent recombination DNA repair protein 1 n=1 Tax=Moniliophthora roreri TaxID=221103 RepID=A0A0W0FC78_MONRR